MIYNKLIPPALPDRLVPRPRLEQLICDLIEDHPMVVVCGTPGAGKTTAMVAAVERMNSAVAWLTLDRTERHPGRLLAYLEAALARCVPAVAGVGTQALAAGTPHVEAAGLIAEALRDEPLVLVIDELNHLTGAESSLETLSSFIRWCPASCRLLIASRGIIQIDALFAPGAAAVIGDEDLAFTVSEAAAALADRPGLNPQDAVHVTGGWVTGVLFENWRSNKHAGGGAGEADPLNGYLSREILASLEPDERSFLITTSVLDEVTAERAEALGITDSAGAIEALRLRHLPVTWRQRQRVLRCHPRFREFLLELLARRDPDEQRALGARHGHLLSSEGHLEEAVEAFVAADEVAEARRCAEAMIPKLIDRMDFDQARQWLDLFAENPGTAAFNFVAADLMIALSDERFGDAAAIGDALQSAGRRREFAESSGRAAASLAWCYFHAGRLDEAHELVAVAPRSPEVDVARYLLSICDRPDAQVVVFPAMSGGALDGLLLSVHHSRGYMRYLSDLPPSRWAAAVSAPWRVNALRALGQTEAALELDRELRTGRKRSGRGYIAGAEVLIDLGDANEASRRLERARAHVAQSGSVFLSMYRDITLAKLRLRLLHDPEGALSMIEALERSSPLAGYGFLAEYAGCWAGLALLLQGRDDEARQRLQGAIASMVAGDRILELPTAAVYLAEAEWREGDEDAADRAADLALTAAQRQGSNHLLLQALSDMPEVAYRRLDMEAHAGSEWHELTRELSRRTGESPVVRDRTIQLREFGQTLLVVRDVETRPRIWKSIELLAYLLSRPGATASRAEVLAALFEGGADSSARSYLRQAIHQLRHAFPEDVVLSTEGEQISIAGSTPIASESRRFSALVTSALRLRGADRIDRLLQALNLVTQGAYLAETDSTWVHRRRAQLANSADEARVEAAAEMFRCGRYAEADGLLAPVVERAPQREKAWQLILRLAKTRGDEDGILRAFLQCKQALEAAGLEPSEETLRLVGRRGSRH